MATGEQTGARSKGTPKAAIASRAAGGAAAARTPDPKIAVLRAGARARGAAISDAKPVPPKRVGRPANPANPGFPKYRVARVATLVASANNPRTHTPAQIAKLKASIQEYGFTNPVLTDGRKGIVAGHGRVLAAQALGMETVPVIELAHLTKEQRRAYVIADNRLALDAGWDDELLALELGELRDEGFDLALTGFDVGELDTLMGEGGDAPGPMKLTKQVTCPKCKHVFPA
jgi:hypothetical protein